MVKKIRQNDNGISNFLKKTPTNTQKNHPKQNQNNNNNKLEREREG